MSRKKRDGDGRTRPVTGARLAALKAWASEAPPLAVRLTYTSWDGADRAQYEEALAEAKADPECAAWMRKNLRSWLQRAPWLDGWAAIKESEPKA